MIQARNTDSESGFQLVRRNSPEPEEESGEEEDNTSQILWIDELTYTRMPLLESIRQHVPVYTFLQIFGVIWPSRDFSWSSYLLQYAWNVLTRLLVVTAACLIVFNFASFLSESVNFVGFDLSSWSLDLIFTMQAVALLSSLVAIRRRLASITTALEVSFFVNSLKYAVIYFAASFFPSILYPLYHILLLSAEEGDVPAVQTAVYAILPFSEVAIAGFLAVHMLFILVDAQTFAANFRELTESTRGYSPTSKRSKTILREIQHRGWTSLIEVLPIVVTALLEIIVLSFMVHRDFLNREFVPMLLLVFLFLKEIQFLALVMVVMGYCVAKRLQLVARKQE
jgi:hypothetical protein